VWHLHPGTFGDTTQPTEQATSADLFLTHFLNLVSGEFTACDFGTLGFDRGGGQ
jgi:hypothetical protein